MSIDIKWILGLSLVLYLICKWVTSRNDFFAKRNVPFLVPSFFFGNLKDLIMKTKTFNDSVLEMYLAKPSEKLVGIFELRNPIFMMRDPDLIKQIAVKDFEYFLDHRTPIDESAEPLFSRGLFSLKGSKWRDMRATLSPAFTGSKMRTMFQLVVQCAENTQSHFLKQAKSQKEPLVLEMKDLFSRFANDVIATSAFGIEVDSLKDPKNEFFEMGRDITNFGGIRSLIFFGWTNFPALMKLLQINIFPKYSRTFFRSLVMDSMKYRNENHIVRPDMINLLMQAKAGSLTHEKEKESHHEQGFSVVQESEVGLATHKRVWEDDDLIAQCLLFFFAGFDTISTMISFTAHELAVQKEIQNRLLVEIDEIKEELQGKTLTYELLSKMPYLDMVVSETLRKWPPAVFTDRKCIKSYQLKYDDKVVNFSPGDTIWLPIFGIHRDPKYYEDPDKFDPERFNDENKHKIQNNAFIPFGLGPRNCIGSRFALMEAKAILFYVLSAFTFEISDKTQVPLKLAKNGFQVRAEKGFWIHLKPRQ